MPANPEYIVVAASDMRHLIDTVERLERKMDLVQITPRPEWVTISEAARMLNVQRRTILNMIDRGELKSRGEGRARMVRV